MGVGVWGGGRVKDCNRRLPNPAAAAARNRERLGQYPAQPCSPHRPAAVTGQVAGVVGTAPPPTLISSRHTSSMLNIFNTHYARDIFNTHYARA